MRAYVCAVTADVAVDEDGRRLKDWTSAVVAVEVSIRVARGGFESVWVGVARIAPVVVRVAVRCGPPVRHHIGTVRPDVTAYMNSLGRCRLDTLADKEQC